MDEIVHYGGEAVPQGHKDEFDPNAPKGSKEDVPGKPGTGEVVTPPVDDVTKYGPVDGHQSQKFRMKQNVNLIQN